MALVSKVIPGFFNGMSQQPPSVRLDTQCEYSLNGLSSLVDGTIKRPPTEHLAILSSNATSSSFIHTIDRDEKERYTVIITDDTSNPVEVFTEGGEACTVRYGKLDDDLNYTADSTVKEYLKASTARDQFKATTVADYTLITNKGIAPVMDEYVKGISQNRALVYIKNGQPETTYSIYLNGSEAASYTTGDSTDYKSYLVDEIAAQLVSKFAATSTSNYTGDGVTTKFLAQSSTNIVVYINNVAKALNVDYTVSGNEITFALPPSAGNKSWVDVEEAVVTTGLESTPTVITFGNTVSRTIANGDGGSYTYTSWEGRSTSLPDGFEVLLNGNKLVKGTDYTYSFKPVVYKATTKDEYVSGENKITFSSHLAGGSTVRFVTNTGKYSSAPDAVKITSGNVTNPYLIQQNHATIMITKSDATDFTITTKDTWGDQAMTSFKTTANKFTDLPGLAFPGYTVEIVGDINQTTDNYCVMYNAETKTWTETVAPNLKNRFNTATMPHKLVRTGFKEFTFSPVVWAERQVGTSVTAPEPSFIGRPINDIFFFKNRLGFLAGENVILSKAGDFFDFWNTTAVSVLDDDPIDISVTTNEVATLRHAIPFNQQLLMFSDQAQFILSSGTNTPLTIKSAAIELSTHYPTSKSCSPVSAGANVYFVCPRGDHTTVKEYFVQPQTLTNDAADVAAHVPRLLPSEVSKIVSVPNMDTLFFLCPSTPKNLYVYRYYWSGDQKAQSSWGVWEFSEDILNIDVLGTKLILIKKTSANAIRLGYISMEKKLSGSLPFRVHLDDQKLLTGVYNSTTDITTWTLPYNEVMANSDWMVVDSSTGNRLVGVTTSSTNKLSAPGNHTTAYCGKGYDFTYTFSEWFVKAPDSNVASLQGRLQMRSLTLNFTNTGNYSVEVTPFNRDKITHQFTATTLGVSLLGTPALKTGSQKFLMMSNAQGTTVSITNDSYLPCEFHSASFEGFYSVRNRPV